jgi:hypothetical protein
MARGWESKAIESQQDDAARDRVRKPDLTPAPRVHLERRRTLELTRARVAADRERAVSVPHRRMLDEALAAIDEQLAHLTE